MHATDMSAIAGNSPNSQGKQSNASGHSVELSEQSTPRGTKRENADDDEESGEEEVGSKNEKRAGRSKIKNKYIIQNSPFSPFPFLNFYLKIFRHMNLVPSRELKFCSLSYQKLVSYIRLLHRNFNLS